MRLLLRVVATPIRVKIILPYLLLAILLVAAVTHVSARLTAASLQDRLNNRLVEAGQATGDALVAVEDRQIEALRTVAFTAGVAEAVSAGDEGRLAALLRPIWANAGLTTLVVFDRSGAPLISWQRTQEQGPADPPAPLALADLNDWWLARQILSEHRDAYGDKFSAFRDGRLWTAAPITHGDQLAGGALVGIPLDELLATLQKRSHASITTFYDSRGVAVATTQIVAGEAEIASVPLAVLSTLLEARGKAEPGHVQDTTVINGRGYQVAYSPLRVRRTMDGFFAVALPRTFIVTAWEAQRAPLLVLNLTLLAGVVAVGLLVARQITIPLAELVTTAKAVAAGNLQRRSRVRSHDEVGQLAHAFNHMTGRLHGLYATVAREDAWRAAILSGIADSVIVCDARGTIVLMNPAAEELFGVHNWRHEPYTLDQLPLEPEAHAEMGSPEQPTTRYRAGDRVLSASIAELPAAVAGGGTVIVLRDISAAAALERAKTDLIALISHELRTPLTAIHGASELLCRGVVGALEPLQRDLAETALRQSRLMSGLVDKAVMVAGIELGNLPISPQPISPGAAIANAVASQQSAAAAAGAELTVEARDDLPLVLADERLLAFALGEVLDNAIKYGEGAPIHIGAAACEAGVILTVHDAGPGIAADQLAHLFDRLRRSDNAVNTATRGLGLGLTLARELIGRQGGSFHLQSAAGAGTTVTIMLSLAEVAELVT